MSINQNPGGKSLSAPEITPERHQTTEAQQKVVLEESAGRVVEKINTISDSDSDSDSGEELFTKGAKVGLEEEEKEQKISNQLDQLLGQLQELIIKSDNDSQTIKQLNEQIKQLREEIKQLREENKRLKTVASEPERPVDLFPQPSIERNKGNGKSGMGGANSPCRG
tara:strand:- start:175 stop:675 length:501 start_codon:yes stop_codon:yes gene_type:complete